MDAECTVKDFVMGLFQGCRKQVECRDGVRPCFMISGKFSGMGGRMPKTGLIKKTGFSDFPSSERKKCVLMHFSVPFLISPLN